ncbi:MAG: phosphotransferase, partial [Chlamydiales bacterium]|nr:phosphotransferase [Chlamydiales bacterium]
MLQSRPPSEPTMISCLKAHYGLEVASLIFLPLGADLNASVYKVQTFDQKYYFVKLKTGHHHDTGVEIVELLQVAGIREIIPPIKTIHGKKTQRIDDFTLIVYPFVDGQDGFNRDLTDDQWATLGNALRQVHEIEVPLSIQHKIRRETYSAKWREIVRSMYVYMEAKPIAGEIASKLQKFLKKNIPAIRRLVDRAEQLGEKLQTQSPQFVLCHSDLHAGNVLIDGNHTIYIVDWDEFIMAPKERDLMFIGGGVGNVWNKPHEERNFYKGYGKT